MLDAFKPGLCWLREVVLPEWRARSDIAHVEVRYRPFEPTSESALDYRIRWLQELFPADEFIAEALDLALDQIKLIEAEQPST